MLIRASRPSRWRWTSLGCAFAFWLVLPVSPSRADDEPTPDESKNFKLTVGNYFYKDPAGNFSGQDANLRYRRGDTSVWIGYYHDPDFGGQARTGFDTEWQPFKSVPFMIQPSLQAATKGFFGGSLTGQIGETWYAQAGIGRTNLQPYFNLNFDPNDALTFAVGHKADDGTTYSLTTVKDDRLHTGQRHTHLVGQWPLPHGQQLTIDILRKTGDGDDGHVAAWGETITYDFARWFIRESYDPKQNFDTADATRISIGARF